MKTIRAKLYALEISFLTILFFALFALNIEKRLALTIITASYTILSILLINKKEEKSIHEKHVSILMLIISFIYLSGFYLLGLYYGFLKSKYLFTINNIFGIAVPTAIIIISSEIIRKSFLSQNGIIKMKGRKVNFSAFLTYIAMVLIDLILYTGIYSLSNLDDFLTVIGYILFSSIANNLLFNYVSKRFGPKPIIIFKLITSLYVYIIPYVPDVYMFLRTFLKVLTPYIIYIILERTYSKSFYKERGKKSILSYILLASLVLIIMLVSCQFKYGAIVIGSDSMTGSINKGDVVIYKRYDGERIDINQVILFDYNNIKTVHRVISRTNVNGETRYTTKGDYNKREDGGYRKEKDIKGIVKIRIKYIGLLTLWFRSLFE